MWSLFDRWSIKHDRLDYNCPLNRWTLPTSFFTITRSLLMLLIRCTAALLSFSTYSYFLQWPIWVVNEWVNEKLFFSCFNGSVASTNRAITYVKALNWLGIIASIFIGLPLSFSSSLFLLGSQLHIMRESNRNLLFIGPLCQLKKWSNRDRCVCASIEITSDVRQLLLKVLIKLWNSSVCLQDRLLVWLRRIQLQVSVSVCLTTVSGAALRHTVIDGLSASDSSLVLNLCSLHEHCEDRWQPRQAHSLPHQRTTFQSCTSPPLAVIPFSLGEMCLKLKNCASDRSYNRYFSFSHSLIGLRSIVVDIAAGVTACSHILIVDIRRWHPIFNFVAQITAQHVICTMTYTHKHTL